jgi:hypothetical protein
VVTNRLSRPKIRKALSFGRADELFAVAPKVHRLHMIAEKQGAVLRLLVTRQMMILGGMA